MEKSLYLAAMEGNVDFLREVRDREIESGCWDNFIHQSLTPQQNNVIHIASQYDQYEFLKSGFNFRNFNPLMIYQTNANGDTPVHVASKKGNRRIVEVLVEISKKFVFREVEILNVEIEEEVDGNHGIDDHGGRKLAWRIKNLEGNTALHQAIINGKVEVAKCLLEADSHLASFVNNNGETPLHLAIKYNVDGDKKLAIDTIEQLNKQKASVSFKGCCLEEESVSLISVLIQKHKAAVYSRDKDGLTPLLRAALVCHVGAIEVILNECPESSEMCDPTGKTVLHLLKFPSYKFAKKCMKIPQLFGLKDQQDDMGNTPAHLAVMNGEKLIVMEEQKVLRDDHHNFIGVIRALLESSANFSLKNKQGLSAATLLQEFISHFPDNNNGKGVTVDMKMMKAMLRKNKLVMVGVLEELIVQNDDEMVTRKYEAIRKALGEGDVRVLKKELETLESLLLKELLKLGDVVYTLLEACRTDLNKEGCYKEVEELIMLLLKNNPFLISQTNVVGDTFLHTMLRFDNEISDSFLHLIKQCCEKALQHDYVVDVSVETVYCPLWRMKNAEGNTPLHQALLHVPKPRIVQFLLQCDKDVVKWFNNQSETPLHVLCRAQGESISSQHKEVAEEIIKENIWAVYKRDITDGYTPLLRATKENKFEIVKQIYRSCPNTAKLRDQEGKTFWHLMAMSQFEEVAMEMIEEDEFFRDNKELKDLAKSKDNNGKTPLDLAFENQNFHLARFLRELTGIPISNSKLNKNKDRDFKIKYTIFIVNLAKFLPKKMQLCLWEKMKMIPRSFIGVKDDEIKDFISTIGVIAALLATMAFTAAFTVPGGFDSSSGNPALLHYNCTAGDHRCVMDFYVVRSAYWGFMVADILTMCLSITILYCLVWIIQGDKEDKIVITDFIVLLLQPTFFSTMVTLMMGVFASTYKIQPKLAIYTVIVCSITIFVLQRCVVMYFFKYFVLTLYYALEVLKDWSAYNKVNQTKARQETARDSICFGYWRRNR